jgi:uncharacterized iron-regulated membrane protein
MLCITGLPLVFYHDILHWQHAELALPAMPESTPSAPLSAVEAAAHARHPQEVVTFLGWDEDEKNLLFVGMAPRFDSPPEDTRLLAADGRTAKILGEINLNGGIMYVLRTLHVNMFAGIIGQLFLGVMGLVLVIAIISGTVLYAPFMRRLDFGTVRRDRGRRVHWLDLHNLLGIVTLCWLTVVGVTGVINTWADPIFKLWQFGQLAEMISAYKDKPPPTSTVSIDTALQAALAEAPAGKAPAFIGPPGSLFSGRHHFGVFLRGDEHLTAKLLMPVLVDAETGRITDMRHMPWYVDALFVSQPLHFGDYAGLPLKILWVLLDLASIVVLVSGLYLLFTRRRQSEVPAELKTGAAAASQAAPAE